MSFVVLNTTGAEVLIADLGQRVLGLEELDLLGLHEYDDLSESSDLASLITAGTLQRLDSLGGSPVPSGTEFDDSVQPHTHPSSVITDFDSAVGSNTVVDANTTHRLSVANPHSVNPAQIGAANAVHTHVAADITDFVAAVNANESVTTLALVGNDLQFTAEDGSVTTIDLSVYVDDTNLARIVSGTVDAAGIATFTRDDLTTFTVDFSGLNDQLAISAAIDAHEASVQNHDDWGSGVPADGEVPIWNDTAGEYQPGPVTATVADAEAFGGYDSLGNTAIGTSWTDIPLDGESLKTAGFTHSGSSAEVTVNNNGRYSIGYDVTVQQTGGNSRSEVETRLMVDRGSGYVEEPGFRGKIYSRQNTQDGTTASASLPLDLDAGDKVKVQAIRSSGGGSMFTEANGSRLRLMTIGSGNPGAGSGGPVTDTVNAIALPVGGSASNAADQAFNVDLSQYGFEIGDVARIGAAYVRGDLGTATEFIDVGFDSTANPKLPIGDEPFADDAEYRTDYNLVGSTANVVDIGSGVPGIQVFVSPDASVNFSPAGMPNSWWWQLALDILH